MKQTLANCLGGYFYLRQKKTYNLYNKLAMTKIF